MRIREAILLLPCHGLEDFPKHLNRQEAHELLSAWVALWHPILIEQCGAPPRWLQASQPPSDLANRLLVLPSVSLAIAAEDLSSKVEQAGGVIVRPDIPWKKFQLELLSRFGSSSSTISDSCRDDFAALGYAFLQLQLMTRQMRYTSNLDELMFNDQVRQAAEAAMAGNADQTEAMLQSCFDQLGQERDHFYSLDVRLIDVTLLAPSTLGTPLTEQIRQPQLTNYLANAQLLSKLKSERPEAFEEFKLSLKARQSTLVGGLDFERPHPLMTFESLRRDSLRGREAYQQLDLEPPRVFARYSYGMVPDQALVLRRTGYTGSLLVAWESGSYPMGSQTKLSWESPDGTFMHALTPRVIDAGEPAQFLTLGWQVGEVLDREHVPTLVFAHWPNRSCDYHQLLDRITRRTPAFGKWSLVDAYFDETDHPYHQEKLNAQQFRHDWLNARDPKYAKQLLEIAPLYHQLHSRLTSLANLSNLQYQLQHYHKTSKTPSEPGDTSQPALHHAAELKQWSPKLNELWNSLDSLWDKVESNDSSFTQQAQLIEQNLEQLKDELLPKLAKLTAPEALPVELGHATGRMVFNPFSHARRIPVHSQPEQTIAPDANWFYHAGRVGDDLVSLVDVPPLGFIVGNYSAAGDKVKHRVLAENCSLIQNEFLEAQFDSQRGHLRSLHVPGRRGNRFSFHLARRDSDATTGKDYRYTQMEADSVELLTSSSVFALVRAKGRLVQEDGRIEANFEIDYELWRGSRILEISWRLENLTQLSDDPWRSAYVARFAWPTDAAILRTFGANSRETFATSKAIASELIEIDESDYRTHLLTCGLPFHRRIDRRFLETIIAVEGQSKVSHRIGIAVDLPCPHETALQMMDRYYELPVKGTVQNNSGWLFNIDAKHVRMDLEAPLVDDAGLLIGQRISLSETDGKTGNVKIRSLREVCDAYRVDYLGGRLGKLTVESDRCSIVIRANEKVFVDLLWKR